MCDQHSTTLVRINRDSGSEGVYVDECIAPLVLTLNLVGCTTIASCCGHGFRPGNIALADGRELVIARDYDEGRRIDKLFPLTSYGEPVTPEQTYRVHDDRALRCENRSHHPPHSWYAGLVPEPYKCPGLPRSRDADSAEGDDRG